MKTLLRIDSSSQNAESSFSRQLTDEFVQGWKRSNADGKVITRDLVKTSIPIVTDEWIAAVFTPEDNRTPAQKSTLALSDELISELLSADEYVFGVSMYNFSVPAAMKLWIDQVVRIGKTFAYDNGVPSGLLQGKKSTIIMASGAVFEPGTPRASQNFVQPYLRELLAFLGIQDLDFIELGGTAKAMYGVDRATILQPGLDAVRSRFATAAAK